MSPMYEPFEQRRQRIEAARAVGGLKLLSYEEYLAQPRLKDTETRLRELPAASWTPSVFMDATKVLMQELGIKTIVWDNDGPLPVLPPDAGYKYAGEYKDAAIPDTEGRTPLVVAVLEGDRVIGFGTGLRFPDKSEIPVIDVEIYSRRSAGLKVGVTVAEREFSVGVGHVVVATLLEALKRPVFVDATNEDSRYIFRSLGFVHRSRTKNPCLLVLR